MVNISRKVPTKTYIRKLRCKSHSTFCEYRRIFEKNIKSLSLDLLRIFFRRRSRSRLDGHAVIDGRIDCDNRSVLVSCGFAEIPRVNSLLQD